jgi:DNA repair ATPase RecN
MSKLPDLQKICKSLGLQEMEAKTKKLKKLWNRYEQVQAEVEDVRVHRENQQQKEDLLQTVRENDTEGAQGWNDGREAVKRQAYRVFNVTRVAE